MIQKCHFIGIGGIGMSGLARILLRKKVHVSGSDLSSNYVTDSLIAEGAKVFVGHASKNITPEMTVIYSSDIKNDNLEFQEALNLKCPLLHRSDLMQQLMSDYKALVVAGTHGKTTTTGLLINVLMEGHLDPTFAVGGVLPNFKANSGFGKGEYFIAEADESDGTFLKYTPWGGIITNIDNDHMEHFLTENNLDQAFNHFFKKFTSVDHLFWCGDDSRLNALKPAGISYGFNKPCQLRITQYQQDGWKLFFDVTFKGKSYTNIELPLIGKHNALNASAVFGLALKIGLSEETIRTAFKKFQGVLRRCEKKENLQSVLVIDDYAHHPVEIQTTLKAIREAVKEKRLIAVFQPHRYSRTKNCLGTYGDIFDEVDQLFVTDIFAAGEKPIQGLSSHQIVDEIKNTSRIPCQYVARADIVKTVSEYLRPHDVIVGLGAGDITKLSSELHIYNKNKKITKLKIGLIYGGKSGEHEVSLMSANYIIDSLKPEFYEVCHFGITRQGEWLSGKDTYAKLKSLIHESVPKKEKEFLSPDVVEQLNQCDVLFPILHGPNGEDGTIQGFFEIFGKAYIGCDYRSAAICMDKALTKKLMILNGVPTAPFIDFSWHDWKTNPQSILNQIKLELQYPLFVKPVHLGSTIGVYKVESEEFLKIIINRAFFVDNHILVENGLNVRELEFVVIGNDEITVYPPGEIFVNGDVYDYAAKYSVEAKPVSPKANLSEELINEGKYLAKTAYKAAGCCGMARIDCFLDDSGKMWLNEINPIPGFTSNSLYPKICEINGLESRDLIDRLIILGMQRKRQKK
jgi:UDP-N-acetylmuramate--alanine ligase